MGGTVARLKRIIGLFCGIALFLGLSHTLLLADAGLPHMDLYKTIDNCNRIKHDISLGYATDEQLNRSIEIVRQILRAGVNPNVRIPANETAIIRGYGLSLYEVVKKGYLSEVRFSVVGR